MSDLKQELIDLELISERDWLLAVRAAEGSDDPADILFQMTRLKASWLVGSEEFMPVLSDYQVHQILAGKQESLRLQHYVILDRIGAGAMGEVFKARNLMLSRLEAIKTLGRSSPSSRFKREALMLAKLRHPGLVTVYYTGSQGDTQFIAMEYVRGRDLRRVVEQAIADGETVPIWWAVERIIATAEALQHAHDVGVIHRDIKPSNIMITATEELRVLDLGLARLAQPDDEDLTKQNKALGTPEVMPPEQWRNARDVTPASDMYSLGCTFFYLLTGQAPFPQRTPHALMLAHTNDPPPHVSDFRGDVPKSLDAIIARMLAKQPEDRFSSMSELIDWLRPFAPGFSSTSLPNASFHHKYKTVGTAAASAVAAVALTAAFFLMFRTPHDGTAGSTTVKSSSNGEIASELRQNNRTLETLLAASVADSTVTPLRPVEPPPGTTPPKLPVPVKSEKDDSVQPTIMKDNASKGADTPDSDADSKSKSAPNSKTRPDTSKQADIVAPKNSTPSPKESPLKLPPSKAIDPPEPKPNPPIATAPEKTSAPKTTSPIKKAEEPQKDEPPPPDRPTMAQLVVALDHPNRDTRWQAAYLLGDHGADAKPAVPRLIDSLRDEHWTVRCAAVHSLGDIRQEVKATVAALAERLQDTSRDVRHAAAIALGKFGRDARDAVPTLRDSLRDSDVNVRHAAAIALGKIGRDARDAAPALREALQDAEVNVRKAAEQALKRIE